MTTKAPAPAVCSLRSLDRAVLYGSSDGEREHFFKYGFWE